MDKTSKELSVLSYIEKNSNSTQRELSAHVGVSLGTVNIILKRLIKKGLVKIERLQPNSIRYFLTPKGIADKLERTYAYVVRTCREVAVLRSSLVSLLQSVITEGNKANIWFFGPSDEIAQLLIEILDMEFSFQESRLLYDRNTLEALIQGDSDIQIFTWNYDSKRTAESLGVQAVNLLADLRIGNT